MLSGVAALSDKINWDFWDWAEGWDDEDDSWIDVEDWDDWDDWEGEAAGHLRGPQRVKRLFSWWSDAYDTILLEDGTTRKVGANHERHRLYGRRNRGQKPRTRLRRKVGDRG